MSSTTEWRKLADDWNRDRQDDGECLWHALLAACSRLDEQANLLGIANEKWGQAVARAEAAEARCRELETYGGWHPEKMLLEKRAVVAEARIAELEGTLDRIQSICGRAEEFDDTCVWLADIGEVLAELQEARARIQQLDAKAETPDSEQA